MNKKTLLGVAMFTLLFASAGAITAYAYQGDPNVKGPNYSVERHEAMQKAFANNDYNAWKELMGNRGVTRVITADNFARFAEAQRLALQGKLDEANKIRQELGLGNGQGRGNGGCGGGMMRGAGLGQNRGVK